MPLPGIHDPLDVEVGRVVRVLRALPAGPAPADIRDAVVAFVHATESVAEHTSQAIDADAATGGRRAGALSARFADFGGATLGSVVAAVVFDATEHSNDDAEGPAPDRMRRQVVALRHALTGAQATAP